MDRAKFYDGIRSAINLTAPNVAGFEKFLDYAEANAVRTDKLAYDTATAWWETANTMQPVKEAFWLSEAWRKNNLKYYPYYGRGLVQTTWDYNYKAMGDVLGVDLVANPDLLLEWDYALPALFVGMERGLYTGKKLDDYLDGVDESDAEDLREFTNARRIVNGTDKAATIGGLALTFEKALKAGGYDPKPAPAEPANPYPKMKQGAQGPAVVTLQTLLNAKGAKLDADGKFGPGTAKALETYQRTLVTYGEVDTWTWAALLA